MYNMGDSTEPTTPKGDPSAQDGGEVDPFKRLPSFKPPRDFTLTKPDSEETKKKRKASLGRSSKKSKNEKELPPTKAKSTGASSEGVGFSTRRSGRNATATSTSGKVQKIDDDKNKKSMSEKSSEDTLGSGEKKEKKEEKEEKEVGEKQLPDSEQEQKTDGDKEKKDADVGSEMEKCDAQEEIVQEQLADKDQAMDDAAGTAPNTDPQPEEPKEEKKEEADNTQVSTADEGGQNNEPDDKENMKEQTVATQTLE